MTLGGYRERIKKQKRRRVWRWFFTLLFLVLAGSYAYFSGTLLARRDVARLQDEIGELENTLAQVKDESADLRGMLDAARAREKTLEENLPGSDLQSLLAHARARLAQGVSAERLLFAIDQVRENPDCDAEPKVKRFIISTPLNEADNANNAVGFFGAVIITARGTPGHDEAGNPEAWFDPAAPVTITVTRTGGEAKEISGVLPLHHAIVVGGKELRFSLTAGAQGFVIVSGLRCAYP
jgi:hypothetical protein